MSLTIGKIIKFKPIIDPRGSMIAVEGNQDIPFDIKRVYYLYDVTPGEIRGKHAHKELKQVAIAMSGHCKVMLDNGYQKEVIHLKDKSEGLLIDSCVWREIYDFSQDCVLVVLASEHYLESDYLRDYTEYKNYMGVK